MIGLYNAVGLQTIQYTEVEKNLNEIAVAMDISCAIAGVDFPVRLVTLPEGAIQGFPTTPPAATQIPGPETDFLAGKAQALGVYLVGQLAFVLISGLPPDRLFNCLFIISPDGEVIYTRAKCQVERLEAQWSTVPHDVWDAWTAKYGDGLDAFFPVADTAIGRIGCGICMERLYPEVARGLAMNGAEILYMPTLHEPFVGNGAYEVQSRARAMDNTCYMLAPGSGGAVVPGLSAPFDIYGGQSLICDYRGSVIGRHETSDASFVSATIDMEGLRRYRQENLGIGNTLKDLRTEQYRAIYEQPIYPKNLRNHGEKLPADNELAEKEESLLRENIKRLQERGVFVPPSG